MKLRKIETINDIMWNNCLNIVDILKQSNNNLIVLCGTGFMTQQEQVVNLLKTTFNFKLKSIDNSFENFTLVNDNLEIQFIYYYNYDNLRNYPERISIGSHKYLPKRSYYPLIIEEFSKNIIDLYK